MAGASRSPMPAASPVVRRPLSAATAGGRVGMRAARMAPACFHHQW